MANLPAMKRTACICSIVLTLGLHPAFSQSLDSITQQCNKAPHQERLHEYLSLSRYYLNRNPQLSLDLGQLVVDEAKARHQDSILAEGYNRLATAHGMQGQFNESLVNILEALTIWETNQDSAGLSTGYNNLALIYQYQNLWAEALRYHYKALEIKKRQGDTLRLPYSLNNLGEIYMNQGEYLKALTHFQHSLHLCRTQGYYDIMGHALQLNGQAHAKLGNYALATHYLMEALAYHDWKEDTYGKARTFKVLADMYRHRRNYGQALSYYEMALQSLRELNYRDQLALTLANVAEVHLAKDNLAEAMRFAQEADQLGREVPQLEARHMALEVLYAVAKARNQPVVALGYLEEARNTFHQMTDQRQSEELLRLQAGYELAQKQHEIALLQKTRELQLDRLQQRDQQARNRTILAVLALGLFIGALVFIYVLYRQKQYKARHNRVLKEKNSIISHHQEEIMAQSEQLKQALEKINAINQTLEKKVQERTALLAKQNEQLAQFAFMNAHELRGPLASILGLVHLLKIPEFNHDDEIIQRLEGSSRDLDAVVRGINRTLEQEYNVHD